VAGSAVAFACSSEATRQEGVEADWGVGARDLIPGALLNASALVLVLLVAVGAGSGSHQQGSSGQGKEQQAFHRVFFGHVSRVWVLSAVGDCSGD
jgi:hypothetical protein